MEREARSGSRGQAQGTEADGASTVGRQTAVDRALGEVGGGAPHASGARLHTGRTAAAAASELDADAFAAGDDVFFDEGKFAPGTPEGDRLLRHELAHVQQTRGAEAPRPGAYAVAEPDAPAERAAEGAERGESSVGTAPGGTIHRKKKDKKAAPSTALQEFFDALASKDVAAAKAKWIAMKPEDKLRLQQGASAVKTYPAGLAADPVISVLEIMAKDGLEILKDSKAAWDKLKYADHILDDTAHDAPYWMTALEGENLFSRWLGKFPQRAALTEARATKLARYMTAATDARDAKGIFEVAYPDLQNASYGPTFLRVDAWALGDIQRMWTSLQGKLPLAHVATITGGFYLGTEEKLFKKNSKGETIWSPLGFGWHHQNRVVMPKASSKSDEGGTGHDMTGGTKSGVTPTGTAADPELTHWDGTMLHEIGHGVGERTDGNSWAKKHGEWKGGMSIDKWSKKLFDDKAAKTALGDKPPKKVLSTAHAREFLAREIAGESWTPPNWKRDKVVDFIKKHYASEKLVQYWTAVKNGTDAYRTDAHNDGGDDRVYVWLSRGNLFYTSYKKEIADKKVSWYSLSSTVEWFAEQYANYYRTGKAAPNADKDTKAKLDKIDQMESGKNGKLKKGAANGPDGGSEAGDTAPVASSDPDQKGGGPKPAEDHTAIIANLRRMNFD